MKKEVSFGVLIVLLVGGFLYFQVNKFNKNNQALNKPLEKNQLREDKNFKNLSDDENYENEGEGEDKDEGKNFFVSPTISQIKNIQLKTFTMTEVEKHNNKNDCWLVIDEKVYNVTNYIGSHPGGKVMANFCGQEATAAFNTKGKKGEAHKPVAYEVLKSLYIGNLK